ncbi:MAG: FkbM family methyltransferase [Syntrophales bacterium]
MLKKIARSILKHLGEPSRLAVLFNAGRYITRNQEHFRFFFYLLKNFSRSNSQLLQDLWVLWETEEMKSGFFIEFGAANGILHSNTLILENEYSWQGILIEPVPMVFDQLKQNRSVHCFMGCVAFDNSLEYELDVTSDELLSGIRRSFGIDPLLSKRVTLRKTIYAKAIDLIRLVEDIPFTKDDIDFLSIDTEGSELDILKHLGSFLNRVRLVAVEHNYRAGRERDLDDLMIQFDHKRVFKGISRYDAWYKRER